MRQTILAMQVPLKNAFAQSFARHYCTIQLQWIATLTHSFSSIYLQISITKIKLKKLKLRTFSPCI